MFSLFFIAVLFLLFNPGYTDAAQEFAKSAEEAIGNYIKGYSNGDYEAVIFSDLHMLKNFILKVESFPKPFQEEEGKKELAKAIESLKKFEQKKLSKGTSLTTSMRLNQQKIDGSGMNLIFILYPKMKYEILEVRDTPQMDILQRADESEKMALVQMTYSNPENAPFFDANRNSKVKSIIVKVYLFVNDSQYAVSGYFPIDYKRELFGESPKELEKKKKLAALESKSNKPSKIINEFLFQSGKPQITAYMTSKSGVGVFKGQVTDVSIRYSPYSGITLDELEEHERLIYRPRGKYSYNILFSNITDIKRGHRSYPNRDYIIYYVAIDLGTSKSGSGRFKYHSIKSNNKDDIDKLYNILNSAISNWYNKYSGVTPKQPTFLSKTATKPATNQRTKSMNQAPVFDIQRKLKVLGYYKGKVDGIAGRRTSSAIKAYQQDNNLTPDGIPSKTLLTHLETQKSSRRYEKSIIDRYSKGFSGNWVGTYSCNQGITGLTLNISTTSSDMEAVFNFYPTKQNPHIQPGSFSLAGQFSEGGSFNLHPKAWIKRPPGYRMVGLSGKLNSDFSKISGLVKFSGCSNFQLVKNTSNKPIQTSKKTQKPQTLEDTVEKAVDSFFNIIFKKQ